MLLLDYFSFFCFSFSFFNIFLLSLASILLSVFLWFFRRALWSTWKKIQVQIRVSNKKAVVKISRISNSKGPSWNIDKFHSELFLVNVSKIACWIFTALIFISKFWLWINGKLWKHLVFMITHICTFAQSV